MVLLEELKEVTPKEPAIYFLIGKIHKKLGNSEQALNYFKAATDFDVKSAFPISNQVESLQSNNADDIEIE